MIAALFVHTLLAWLLALTHWPDRQGHPLSRPERAAQVVSVAAAETEWPQGYAAMLDVLGPHESGWRPEAIGDGGKSCGLFQTPCAQTPGFVRDELAPKGWRFVDGRGVALAQARLAVKYLERGNDSCPGHPLWTYASGHCASSTTALWYESMVRQALAVPLEVAP